MPEFTPVEIGTLLIGFLLGSIPFGPIIARGRGVDLREVGSGNPGATNVLRAVGKGAALVTLLLDMGKGVAAVALARALGMGPEIEGYAGALAVLGHVFSPFLMFRGGKGVATAIGAVLIYSPKAGMLTIVLWLVTVAASRMSSLGALISFGILPVAMAVLGEPMHKVLTAGAISCLLILRHSANIRRIMNGTENRIGHKA